MSDGAERAVDVVGLLRTLHRPRQSSIGPRPAPMLSSTHVQREARKAGVPLEHAAQWRARPAARMPRSGAGGLPLQLCPMGSESPRLRAVCCMLHVTRCVLHLIRCCCISHASAASPVAALSETLPPLIQLHQSQSDMGRSVSAAVALVGPTGRHAMATWNVHRDISLSLARQNWSLPSPLELSSTDANE